MKKIYFFLLAAVAITFSACSYDEDELTASDEPSSYQLPQNGHDYDQTIADFYKATGKYLIYEFNDKDAYYTPSGWKRWEMPEENPQYAPAAYLVKPADQAYVGQQIELLNEVWFSKLSDKARQKLLPVKLLLCSEVDSCYATATYEYILTPVFSMKTIITEHQDNVNGWYNYDHFCLGYGNSTVASLTDAQKKAFACKIFHLWPEYIAERIAPATSEFLASVNYDNLGNISYIAKCCEAGILANTYNNPRSTDWTRFILMMLNYSEDWLNDATITAPGQYDDWTNYAYASYGASYIHEPQDFHGILSSVKDTKGILKRRYQMVRQYFIDNYDMDLQSIGNTMWQL